MENALVERSQSSRENSSFAIVYLGKKIPKYIFSNLRNIVKNFPDRDVWLITEKNVKIRKTKVNNFKIFEVDDQEEIYEVLKRSELDNKFRQGFWKKTLFRLYAIAEFTKHVDKRIIQVEGDVHLFNSFPVDIFDLLDCEIAFPMETIEKGAPSTLFIKNKESALKFIEIMNQALSKNSHHTDMTLLGALTEATQLDLCLLPSWNKKIDYSKKLHVNSKNDLTKFRGIFDTTTLGIYLTGEDPRNHQGMLKLFTESSNHISKPSEAKLRYIKNNLLISIDGCNEFFVHSLHLHSKQLKLFNENKLRKTLIKNINDSKETSAQKRLYYLTIKLSINKIIKTLLLRRNNR